MSNFEEKFEEYVSEHLRRAKMHLLTYGWMQGAYGCEEGACCASGALLYTEAMGEGTYDWAVDRLNAVVKKDFGHIGVVDYNDQPGRTFNDILDVYAKAINEYTNYV